MDKMSSFMNFVIKFISPVTCLANIFVKWVNHLPSWTNSVTLKELIRNCEQNDFL